MKLRKWRIAMDVPKFVQAYLEQRTPRLFPWVYGWSITWAYKVEDDFRFDDQEQQCSLYGLHTGVDYQSFAAKIGPHTHQPDGRILHLTYCTAPGVEPVRTGLFDVDDVAPLSEPLLFKGRLARFPLWNRKPVFAEIGSSS